MKIKPFRYHEEHNFATRLDSPLTKDEAKKSVRKSVDRFANLQERLYADDRHSLLLIFQGMDAAGKDSTINHVMSGVNPAGFQVFSFKKPSSEELDHNFLWRGWRSMPERGRIGIFNRSYYEEVLVVHVHPTILESRRLPNKQLDNDFWESRYDDIRSMEKHLARNGTRVLKFFLNVSKSEQKNRFMGRLNDPKKHWKFSSADLNERQYWDQYQEAFRKALRATDRTDAPWYIIPADDKWNMRAIVAGIIVEELNDLNLDFPEPDPSEIALFEKARRFLESEDD